MPTSSPDLRRLSLKGKHAFLPTLGRQAMNTLREQAHVSLVDCIVDLLGHGMDLDVITGNIDDFKDKYTPAQFVTESKRDKEIWDYAIMQYHESGKLSSTSCTPFSCLYTNEWSDGFEPHYYIKAPSGSAWLKAETISPPQGNKHGLSYTYSVGLSSSSCNHEEVEEQFAEVP